MNLRDWRLRIRSLVQPGRVERELQEELAFHIERETRHLVEQGMTADEARVKAQVRFGSPAVAADECRDARGTAFIDDTARDIAYAARSIGRAPLTSFTIVATVSTGLGIVAVLFTLLNTFIFRVDQVPDVDEIYQVQGPELGDGVRARFSRAQFDLLRAETSAFSDAYAELPGIDIRVDGNVMAVTLVSGNFFQVARVTAAMGRALGPTDDGSSGGNAVIVLSDRGWNRRFNRDPAVLGRTVLVGGMPFEIVGVMPAGFRGLAVGAPDFWAPLSQLAQFVPAGRDPGAVGVDIIGRLKPGMSRENARAQVATWASNQPARTDRGAMTVDLIGHRGTVPQPLEAIAVFTPLFLAFGLILMIGCANVANLLLARGVARQREIGIRLSVGGTRGRIIRQLMTESVLLALVSAGGGYLVSRLALQGTISWILRIAPVDVGDINLSVPAADWRVALFLVAAAVVSTAFFALVPALQATRIDPVRTLRGELVKDARPGRARNWLIGVQVFASALLLIGASIFLRSGIAAAKYDPGFRSADTVMIEINNEPKRQAMVQAIATEAEITQYAALRPSMFDTRDAFAVLGTGGKTAVSYKFVSGAYFGVIDIPIVRGRTFTAAERDGHPVAVVTESMARMLWPNGNAIGESFRIERASESPTPGPDELPLAQTVTVVGVARDTKGFRFGEFKTAVIFLPTSLDAADTAVLARVASDPDRARQTLLDHLTRIDPNLGMIVTMRTIARLETFLLDIAFWIAFVLGTLALLLTVSGLFSVLSYLVAQRTKEIGVRMALGASAPAVTRLMMSQTARPVLYGLLAGAGLAGTLATVLRATPLGGVVTPIVHVSDPVAYAGGLTVIVLACVLAALIPAARASKVDPMQTLRQE